ncbi:class I SAM-dependent methyltransferase [Actinoplanes sp. TRM 88003]|uniref:Class I SAM-dependent methyltransferase n=1 Tax=Paractinoplanes aksuensis TaxID=2939490 RepID=A0ABT1DPM5_9ACTN|nr:class I SAM-dependent methyltransferase [Actinoplanes aksuensis]MCO8271945.1 class I SAM-dependent methyltransferase [Actinoplanes aksuensis]
MTRFLRTTRTVVRRLRGASRRQLAGLVIGLLVAAGVAVSSGAGQAALATGLLALLLAAVLAGVIHLSRRMARLHRSNQEAVRELRGTVDQLQRRVIAAVEKERLAAGDRHLELTEALARTERLTARGAEVLLHEQSREIEAMFQLFRAVTPRAPMPAGGVLHPTDLLGLVHLARERRPGLTVTLGCGPSTVWLGYAVGVSGGRLVAVEHDENRAIRVRAKVAEHGLSGVEVRHVPLAELSVDGRSADWYDVDALDGLSDIDLLLVDGTLTPAATDPLAPALHVLGRRLAPAAAVVVDDEPARVAPRQGGGFGLTVRRRLPGRWTALTHPQATASTVG